MADLHMTTVVTVPDRLSMGGNNPPAPTPYEVAREGIETLYGEAAQWLDGETVDRPELADGLAKLQRSIQAARKAADAARKTEAEPFDAGKAEVQARYKPLLDKADRVIDACKRALAPWLVKLEVEKLAAAQEAQRKADEATRAARTAIQSTSPDNLAAREAAEQLVTAAKTAEHEAALAAHDTAKINGGVGRAVSLRTTYKPVLVDAVAAARYYWDVNQPAMTDFLVMLAEKDVRAGKRSIPGFEIHIEKTPV